MITLTILFIRYLYTKTCTKNCGYVIYVLNEWKLIDLLEFDMQCNHNQSVNQLYIKYWNLKLKHGFFRQQNYLLITVNQFLCLNSIWQIFCVSKTFRLAGNKVNWQATATHRHYVSSSIRSELLCDRQTDKKIIWHYLRITVDATVISAHMLSYYDIANQQITVGTVSE